MTRVLFYPDLPHERAVLSRVCKQLNYTPSNVLTQSFSFGLKWKDTTYHSLSTDEVKSLNGKAVYNIRCTDISKATIHRLFYETFGKPLGVLPEVYEGLMVCKSDRNAAHDGVIVEGPLNDPLPDKVYCKLINNIADNDAIDYRVPLLAGAIPLVYVKRRPVANRFANRNTSVSLTAAESAFSTDELKNITDFSQRLGMDYGELDILRDRNSHQIYIVDANNTPYGPPNGLPEAEQQTALRLLAAAFQRMYPSCDL